MACDHVKYEIKVVFDKVTLLGVKNRRTNTFTCVYDNGIRQFTDVQSSSKGPVSLGVRWLVGRKRPTTKRIIHSLLYGVCDSLFEVIEVTHNIPSDILDAFSIECLEEFL